MWVCLSVRKIVLSVWFGVDVCKVVECVEEAVVVESYCGERYFYKTLKRVTRSPTGVAEA